MLEFLLKQGSYTVIVRTGTRDVFKLHGIQCSSFKWAILCTTQLKAFCFYCRFAAKRNLIVFSTKADNVFTIEGFCNWKKATEKFNLHEQSHAHREAALKYSCIINQLSIEKQLHLRVEHDQVERRKMFLI